MTRKSGMRTISVPEIQVDLEGGGDASERPAPWFKDIDETTLRVLNRRFLAQTSGHGLKATVEGGARTRRIVWGLLFTAGCLLFAYTTAQLVVDYRKFESVTDINIEAAPGIEFPSVTVCNLNPFLRGGVNGTRFATPKLVAENGYTENFTYDDWAAVAERLRSWPPDPIETKDLCHSRRDLIFDCTFAGEECYPSDFTSFLDFEYCTCVTFQPDYTSRITGAGRLSDKLSIIIDIEQWDYLPTWSDVAGAKVVIHDPSERPFPSERGFTVKPGDQVLAAIRRTEIYRMSAPYGQCDDTGEYAGLSVDECRFTLLSHRLKERCGCFNPYLLRHAHKLSVNPAEYCNNPFKWSCVYNETDAFFDDYEAATVCKQKCKEIGYDYSLSSARFPLPATEQLIVDQLLQEVSLEYPEYAEYYEETLDTAYFSENLIKLEIYFQELNVQKLEQRRATTFVELLSSIGGSLGLFLGFSMLTILEFFELGIVSMVKCARNGGV